ncbi:hypothetical protein R5R35_005182 [Gryllus longicercus]|uniref:Uncharacterized protein n=1 Tax=Gryllus longicercus TaxID=2509291 RepID=A0AAN9VY60_9ORTH
MFKTAQAEMNKFVTAAKDENTKKPTCDKGADAKKSAEPANKSFWSGQTEICQNSPIIITGCQKSVKVPVDVDVLVPANLALKVPVQIQLEVDAACIQSNGNCHAPMPIPGVEAQMKIAQQRE